MPHARTTTRARTKTLVRMAPLLLAVALAGCKVDLYSGLSEREANEILAILVRADLDVERVLSKDGLNTVRVEKDGLATAVELLSARGYPKHKHATMADVFDGGGLIQSPTQERARYVFALGEELSRTISDIDGVVSARVHVVLPKSDPLRSTATPSSASVFIRHEADAGVPELLAQIKMLVANSIDDLSYDKVAVVFVPVRVEEIEPVPPDPVPTSAMPTTVQGVGDAWTWLRGIVLARLDPVIGGLLGVVLLLGVAMGRSARRAPRDVRAIRERTREA